MLIKIPRGWEIPERLATPERVYMNRRKFLAGTAVAAAGGIGAWAFPSRRGWAAALTTELRPLSAPRNAKYTVDHPITSERVATGYNNYYEFTEAKDQVWRVAQDFQARPWQIEIKGQVGKPRKIDVDELIRQMPLEERVYHHRCVEAWTIYVPWIGFPMKKFVEWCQPTSRARYVRMVSFFRPGQAEGQKRATGYPWPYF